MIRSMRLHESMGPRVKRVSALANSHRIAFANRTQCVSSTTTLAGLTNVGSRWTASIIRLIAGVGLMLVPAAGQADSQFGIFVGPPVPVASRPYSIRVKGLTDSPPIIVENITVGTSGDFVDITLYINHGSSITSPASYEGSIAGPLLSPGTYTFREFTRERSFGQGAYSEAGPPRHTLTVVVTPSANSGDAVEYYHSGLKHYFLTANNQEVASLDAGLFSGWTRTGEVLPGVYLSDPSSPNVQTPLAPVCRYYGLPSAGLDTHFFSASTAECAEVALKWPTIWQLETPSAFLTYLPNVADGSCTSGTIPVYRLYNNRPDANHRYTTSLEIRQVMIDQLWIPEGYGTLGVVMCVNGS
jgi:hypothetical protein